MRAAILALVYIMDGRDVPGATCVVGNIDAGHAGDMATARSTPGWTCFIAGTNQASCLIDWG